MVFRNFDRLVFAAAETTAGTAATIDTSTDFFEVIEPTFTVTPLMFERFTKSQTLTTQVQTVPGTAKATPVATCEMSFGVELAGPGTAVSSGTAPKIDRLLRACGFAPLTIYKYSVTANSYSGGPFYHLENIEGTAGSFSSADAKSFGCNAYGDSEFLAFSATTLGTTAIKSEHSGATATATGTAASQLGIGYAPATIYTDTLANSCITLRMVVGGGGEYVEMKGAKGTFEMVFTHGDRVVVNFTFTGVLNEYNESGSYPTNHSYTAEVPPAWIGTGMSVQEDTSETALWTSALFNSMTLTMGNEVTVREDTNSSDGYAHAVITNRAPQLTWNPDAVLSTGNYDFWDKFLKGSPARMRWSVGTTAGNQIDFRVTSAQFSGIADGDRDTVSVLDTTTMLTGGSFGSSIVTSGGDPSSSKMGSDNELQILFR
jgi:hypothetical protein